MRAKLLSLVKARWWLAFVWLFIHSLTGKPILVGECLILLGLVYLDRKHLFKPFADTIYLWRMRRYYQKQSCQPRKEVDWKREGF